MDAVGVDFNNSDIAFVGTSGALDFESIAALEPDLIIGLPYNALRRCSHRADRCHR
jgi:ABC-type Fe3+-hydroxamate transport system substrate-binding protein